MPINRVREITLPDGTAPYVLPGSLLFTGFPEPSPINMAKAIGADGEDFQSTYPLPFDFSVSGPIYGSDYPDVRATLDAMEAAISNRNRRFYINDDRYWWVRGTGWKIHFPYPGARMYFAQVEAGFRILNPFLFDSGGTAYRWW